MKMADIKFRMKENSCPKPRKPRRRKFGKRRANGFGPGESSPMGSPELSEEGEGLIKVEENLQY